MYAITEKRFSLNEAKEREKTGKQENRKRGKMEKGKYFSPVGCGTPDEDHT